jgi:hypothetical protein
MGKIGLKSLGGTGLKSPTVFCVNISELYFSWPQNRMQQIIGHYCASRLEHFN